MKKTIIAVMVAITFSTGAIAAQNSSNSQSSGVSNIENQTVIFEGTDLGKYRSEWSKGRVIKPGESVQCWNDNLMRGGIKDPNCKN